MHAKLFCVVVAVVVLVCLQEGQAGFTKCGGNPKGLTLDNILIQKQASSGVFTDVQKIAATGGTFKLGVQYHTLAALNGATSYRVVLSLQAEGTVYIFGFGVTSTQTIACPSGVDCNFKGSCDAVAKKLDEDVAKLMCHLSTIKVGDYGRFWPTLAMGNLLEQFPFLKSISSPAVYFEVKIYNDVDNQLLGCFYQIFYIQK